MRRFKGKMFAGYQEGCGARGRLIGERLALLRIAMDLGFDQAPEDLWVFGYGSLIWRPGFDYLDRIPANIIGMHRSLCGYSFDHRGTPERPGLVLGLDFGGACRGIAYRVAAKHRAATLAYLRAREQTTAVYRELVRGIWLEGKPQRRVEALCYAIDRGHAQYAGRLSHERQLQIVRQGHGRSGNNRDYVIETVKALEALSITDHDLHVLAQRLTGSPDAGA
jgi:cation transport protein ChaC